MTRVVNFWLVIVSFFMLKFEKLNHSWLSELKATQTKHKATKEFLLLITYS